MAELLHQASDDQMALFICGGAVVCCGLIMYFSHHVGRLTGHIRMHETGSATTEAFATMPRPAAVPNAIRERAA